MISRMLRRHRQVVSISGDHISWAGADEMQRVMMCRLPDSLRLGGPYFCQEFPDHRLTPPRSWSYASDDLIDYHRKTEADYDPEPHANYVLSSEKRFIGLVGVGKASALLIKARVLPSK